MALHSLYCADVPLRNCSLTHLEVLCVKEREHENNCVWCVLIRKEHM